MKAQHGGDLGQAEPAELTGFPGKVAGLRDRWKGLKAMLDDLTRTTVLPGGGAEYKSQVRGAHNPFCQRC